jgi:hypothetical protein
MFLCAVARPRPGFDGKIGIWAFTTTEQAQRRSKNHERGVSLNIYNDSKHYLFENGYFV